MTLDDDKSVYVGGLPYECTQEDLRRAFDLYGAIVDVKIINDRQVGGKCYGFVTFRNPRSAVDAIMDMNGRKIGGRVVRVNEVHTRGGRPTFHRESFHRDDRDDDWERGRERERDHVRDRDRYMERNNERSEDRREREGEREMDFHRERDIDRARLHRMNLSRDREDDDHERRGEYDREWGRDHDMDLDHDREPDKSKDRDGGKEMDKEQQPRRHSSGFNDHQSRDLSSNSSDEYRSQVKEQLELSIQRREELQNELTVIEEKVEEKKLLVSDLQKKSQKLEDALAAAKKLTSQRQSMLLKLHTCFLRSQDIAERLKNSEQELQSLVDGAISEVEIGENASTRDGSVYANGKA